MSDNIKVVVKVRPLISREIEEKLFHQWRVNNNTIYQIDQTGNECGNYFTFDKVYDESTNTNDVYNDVAKPIVEAATAGFNGTIFAYGQTSSGKTYTMIGTEESPGIIPLSVINLFNIIKNIPNREFLIRVSYLEIYNETLVDLLNTEKKNIKIQDTLQGVKVDATVRVTTSPEEILQFMKEGQANRQTGSTNMNVESSRSHSIFQITIESREHIEGEEVGCLNVSQLNLVDLAGSERSGQTGATGIRFKEGTHINKALSSLALVIKKLSEGSCKHVNYRDSKLTRILQNSIGGNAKTSIICAVTPAALEETISTLQFAYRAKAIKNRPEVNVVATDTKMIDSMTKQLSSLKTQLESKRNVEENNQRLQKQIAVLQRFLSGLEQPSIEKIMTANRQKNKQLRRATISTEHLDQEDPVPSADRFCTPNLKYNAFSLATSSEFLPIPNSLAPVPEEPPILITPPPKDQRITLNDEIIELDSDDDVSDMYTCSPYHKCFKSKTPPCVLRKNAKEAEKNFKDLVELTEREKIYTPNVVELMEKLEKSTTVITNLEEAINSLNTLNKDYISKMEILKDKIGINEEEVRSLSSDKLLLEARCRNYDTKLTDWEVMYDTLKRKTKNREEELLSLLDEFANKKTLDIGKLHEIGQIKDVTIMKSDSNISIASTNDDKTSHDIQELISNLKEQITVRDNTILQLETNLHAQNRKNSSLDNETQENKKKIDSYEEQLLNLKEENSLLKSEAKTLNSIIENQKSDLETAIGDIQSYNDTIQELQNEISRKEKLLKITLNDVEIEKLIVNEEKLITNNENIRNIIQSLKVALDTKSIQENERNGHIKAITNELQCKEKYITELQEKVATLTQQLQEIYIKNEKLLSEEASPEDLINESENQLKVYINELKNLKEYNQELCNSLDEKKCLEIKLMAKNTELITHVEENIRNIKILENDLKVKDAEMVAINKSHSECITKIEDTICKLLDIWLILTGESRDYPSFYNNPQDVYETLNNTLNDFKSNIIEAVNQRDTLKMQNIELMTAMTNVGKHVITEINSLNNEINMINTTLPKLVAQKALSELAMHEDECTVNNCLVNADKLIVVTPVIDAIKSDIDLQSLLTEIQGLISHMKFSIRNIKLASVYNTDAITQTIESKELEISDLRHKIKKLTTELENKSQELISSLDENTVVVKERDEILNNIFLKLTKVACKLNIKDNLFCELKNDNKQTYINCVLPILDKIVYHHMSNNVGHSEKNTQTDEFLIKPIEEIKYLREKNVVLNENIPGVGTDCSYVSDDLKEMQQSNKYLNEDLNISSAILNDLIEELKVKTNEIDCMKDKVIEWKEQFTEHEILMKKQQHDMQEEYEKLKEKCLHNETVLEEYIAKIDSNTINKKEILHKDTLQHTEHHIANSPLSLLTIAYNNLVKVMQDNENTSRSVTTTSSKSNIDLESFECSMSYLECQRLKSELESAHYKNSELTNLLDELQVTNAHLIKEIQDASEEVKILMAFTTDLQKRILNHRTNLSTLTATTYAENKSLSSQVKFLQHHHTRFHTVCQRDLPELKNQLHELMKLLKEENMEKRLNASFKRYSLPNPLDSNSILHNFKNESTLDGDLLMMETNITLATADNTLTGHDQTCLETTQSCLYNDAASQTIEYYDEPSISPQELCKNEIEMLAVLKAENQKLNEVVKSLMQTNEANVIKKNTVISPIKQISDGNTTNNICKNCQQEKEQCKKLIQELEKINEKLENAVNQKDDIEKKYNSLHLEVPSTEALLRKLYNFEKELKNKSNEIENLSMALKSTKKQLQGVQEENDNLSTQIMESITEVDDLKKELDTFKQIDLENNQKPNFLLTDDANKDKDKIDKECPGCVVKEKYIKVLESKYSSTHLRLNRSYSDSDSSSRYNKICTLQNELDAGREDCNELKEEVTTIKNQLESSDLTNSQPMDLDESIGETNVANLQTSKSYMPKIAEEHALDIYSLDKSDCFNYYMEKVGDEQTNLNRDVKIIDVMKMLYSKLMTKHENHIENLINKLRDYEDSKHELQEKISSITRALEQSNSDINKIESKFSVLRNNIKIIANNTYIFEKDEHTNAIELFKQKVLKILDTEFSMNSQFVFEFMLETTFNKKLNDLNESLENYVKLQDHSEKLANELEVANSNLKQLKCLLIDKENECNLLVAQKAQIHEISDAVTMDLVKKEQDVSAAIIECYRKLAEENILIVDDFDTTIPPIKNLHLLFRRLVNQNNQKIMLEKEREQQIDAYKQNVTKYKSVIEQKNKELQMLTEQFENIKELNKNMNNQLNEKESKIQIQKSLYQDLNTIHNKKIEENDINLSLILKLTEEVNILKQHSECLACFKHIEEIKNLKHVNETLLKEKDSMAIALDKSTATIKQNKLELEKMESDILVLKESVKDNINTIDRLKNETTSLVQQNFHIKGQYDEKCKDLSRLELNIKTHETTAKIQTKIISRLQKQKEEDIKIIKEKEKQVEELNKEYTTLQNESLGMKDCIAALKRDIDTLINMKQSLEEKLTQFEIEQANSKHRSSIEIATENSRQRRRSLHDSKRIFSDKPQDHNKVETIDGRSKADDMFMDVDENSSCRSTPVGVSKRRDSLQSKHEESEGDERSSRSNSVLTTRQRRQSIHDLHRTTLQSKPERHDLFSNNRSKDESKHDLSNDCSVNGLSKELQDRLSACQRELEELKERYRELDDECETCSEYLRERDQQCAKLKKDKIALEKIIMELNEKLRHANPKSSQKNVSVSYAHAAVNTEEDWANLHSVVVDRMSFDAEVEKNKRLTKLIEELRFNKQELTIVVSKMQRALEEKSSKESRELEKTKIELRSCKEELEDLRKRNKELDEECETCAQYLREKDEKCRSLKEAIFTLEATLRELQENTSNISQSSRKKRQTMHDLNRSSTATELVDASTEITEDFLSRQVERDNDKPVTDDAHTKQIKLLNMALENLTRQKAALEQRLMSVPTAPVYVATGSAIVQTQQLADVMKENRKLKKINAELVTLCKKRGKTLIRSNRENQDPDEAI